MTELVDFVINRRILFNISVCRSDISFWLIIIIVADKILDCGCWEKFAKLAAELRRQGLIVRQNQCCFCTCEIIFAIVNVLPEPVTPAKSALYPLF